MKQTIKNYFLKVQGVLHTTLNPRGIGVARIHLIPPKTIKWGIPWVVIINGQDIVPLNSAWAILLSEFIQVMNELGHSNMNAGELKEIIDETILRVQNVFTRTKRSILIDDLRDIIDTITSLAKGEVPPLAIGHLKMTQYAKHMNAPHRMDLMVSSMKKEEHWNCNQHCLHCYAGHQMLAEEDELTTEEWISIIDCCQKVRIPQLTFTGGEPTLRPDLVKLIGHASWFITRLNTNGILLTPDLCRQLYEASLDSVQITLYSSDSAIHNQLVGGNHFDETIAGIKNALANKLNVSINTPLCIQNQDYVETLRFLHDLGVEYVSCSGLILTGEATSDSVKQLTTVEMETLIRNAVAYTKGHQMELAFTSPGWVRESVLKELKLIVPSCGACLSNMAIAPNGDVIPCQSWLSDGALGNILTSSWSSIWNSKRCVQLRRQSVQNTQLCPLSQGNRKEHLT